MANIHVQTAATNLRKAADDLKLYGQQAKAAGEQEIRDMQTRIAAIKTEQTAINTQRMQADNPAVRAGHEALYQKLNQEKKDLEKRIASSRDATDKVSSQVNSEASEFLSLADNLASKA